MRVLFMKPIRLDMLPSAVAAREAAAKATAARAAAAKAELEGKLAAVVDAAFDRVGKSDPPEAA